MTTIISERLHSTRNVRVSDPPTEAPVSHPLAATPLLSSDLSEVRYIPGAARLGTHRQVTTEMDFCPTSGSSAHVPEWIPEGLPDYVFEMEENKLNKCPQGAWCHPYFSEAMSP